jgi:hypothetical protein
MIHVFVYMDESFNDAEFWVTGLVVPEAQAVALERALDQVVVNAAADYGVDPGTELHGYQLMSGKGDWATLHPLPRARIAVLNDALTAIANTSGLRAFSNGLLIEALKRRYVDPHPPRQVLIGYVAQRCHGLLRDGEVLALFVDDNPTKAAIRDHVRHFKRVGTWSRINSRPLENILDTVYFAPSCDSRLLQAADLVSYVHFKSRTTAQTAGSYAAVQEAWGIVKAKCVTNLWKP